ncbi:MAG TPA: TMEM198/TM7SF3 family protein [Anaerolineae bacterium]|nr:TMEM198/TM7SF3 family protein [Anaerolineae bacterium]
MNPINLVAGAAMLILGRKLFWLFVGGMGFIFGITFFPQLLPGQSDTLILTISLIFGFLGALLAILLQKAAVGIAGFISGGYIVYNLLGYIPLDVSQYFWLVVAAGCILGAILAGSMFDWALIVLSSASGAVLITQCLRDENLNLPPDPFPLVLLIGLFIVGVIIQVNMKSKD